ncbi:hypothetical protein [uncultured Anaerococcus sp.]|uniref:hypothetical protein n=1 Tax=uncultured Anaerococcus sp. TaxID=293428 RepID=UPI0025FB00C4|nr:hypothetical protein [uncultured Anaerococcus sp.]
MDIKEYLDREKNIFDLSKEMITDDIGLNYMIGYREGYQEAYNQVRKILKKLSLLLVPEYIFHQIDLWDLVYIINQFEYTDEEIDTLIKVKKADFDMYIKLGEKHSEDIKESVYDQFYSMDKTKSRTFINELLDKITMDKELSKLKN